MSELAISAVHIALRLRDFAIHAQHSQTVWVYSEGVVQTVVC